MAHALHIIASCTDRKRKSASEPLRLRDVDTPLIRARAVAWQRKLAAAPKSALVRAEDLYIGDHWAVAVDIDRIAATMGWAPTLWVASGGYGLVGRSAMLHPYSATFATGHADSVLLAPNEEHDREAYLIEWWEAFSGHAGPQRGAPRTVEKLAIDSPDATILVIASPDYVAALSTDLLSARDVLDDPQRLVIVTSTLKGRASRLEENRVASEARLAGRVGGAMTGLHARVARLLIEEIRPSDFTSLKARAFAQRATAKAPVRLRPERDVMSDAQIRSFLQDRFRADPAVTHSRLLRELRASGRACEQHRFRDLFQDVAEEHHASA